MFDVKSPRHHLFSSPQPVVNMLAARDQENLINGHHQTAASKPLNQSTRGLQPKTPGNKYPKTPLKIPLNDENAPTGFGQTVKGKGLDILAGKKSATFDKNVFVTPMGPRARAPLGMKTTNAKARGFQTPAGPALEQDIEKTIKTSARKPKRVIHGDAVKLAIHGDESPLHERDVEYCPPLAEDLPYESESFPDNCLNYAHLRGRNLTKDIHTFYGPQLDENGMSKLDRRLEEDYRRSSKKLDEDMMAMMEEEWTVGDVPETFRHLKKKHPQVKELSSATTTEQVKRAALQSKGPATITSKRAASALAVAPKPAPLQPKTTKPAPKMSFLSRPKALPAINVPSHAANMRQASAVAASRSTIGYTRGRSASSTLNAQTFTRKPETRERKFVRSISGSTATSDMTITPARFAEEQEWRNPSFLKAFEIDDEDLEPGLRGCLPDCLRRGEESDEEFVMTLGPGSKD